MDSRFNHNQTNFIGISEGGIRTSVAVEKYRILFDVGYLPYYYSQMDNLFLTHGHLDHSAGVPYYISQRSLKKMKGPNIYVPEEMKDDLEQILQLYQKIENFKYSYNLFGLKAGDTVHLSSHAACRAFPTLHRIPSLGYTVYDKSLKLKDELKVLTGDEIRNLRKKGLEIHDHKLTPVISFSGDTQIDPILTNQDVLNSKVLFLECTYLCEERPKEKAREWGHLHLDEIAEHAELFQNEKLVRMHFSKRYSYSEIRNYIRKKLPEDLCKRTVPLIPEKNIHVY